MPRRMNDTAQMAFQVRVALSIGVMLRTPPIWVHPARMVEENWKIVMPYVQRIYHAGTRSSHLLQVEENFGAAVDYPMPDPIPDYGRQKAVLKP